MESIVAEKWHSTSVHGDGTNIWKGNMTGSTYYVVCLFSLKVNLWTVLSNKLDTLSNLLFNL